MAKALPQILLEEEKETSIGPVFLGKPGPKTQHHLPQTQLIKQQKFSTDKLNTTSCSKKQTMSQLERNGQTTKQLTLQLNRLNNYHN